MSDPPGHGTGYEDAITRRIGALEEAVRERDERLARLAATVEELTRDNATLRLRAGAAQKRAGRAGRWTLLIALLAIAFAAAVAWLFLVPR
jgi:hypothetical protein